MQEKEKLTLKLSQNSHGKKKKKKRPLFVEQPSFYKLSCPVIRGENFGPNIMLSGWKLDWRLVVDWLVEWLGAGRFHAGWAGI